MKIDEYQMYSNLPDHTNLRKIHWPPKVKNRRLRTVLEDIHLPDAAEWSATSCGREILLLRAERAIKQSPAGVVARGRPEKCLLDTDDSRRWTAIRDTSRHLAASACDNSNSIHPTTLHVNESGKRLLSYIAKPHCLLSTNLLTKAVNQQKLHTLMKFERFHTFSYSIKTSISHNNYES
ncbi:UNVERIFIED_CONTAM: hypothetical protein NCL1_18806 [Trichonephila clavipes]